MTALAVVLAWIGAEAAMTTRLDSLRTGARVAERFETEQKALDTLDAQLLDLRRTQSFLTGELAQREAFVPRLLRALRAAVSEEIVLSRVHEHDHRAIRVLGTGASDPAIKLFAKRVADALRPARKDVRNLEVDAVAPAELRPTYTFRFEIAPIEGTAVSAPRTGGRR
jgi:hypothetical protein